MTVPTAQPAACFGVATQQLRPGRWMPSDLGYQSPCLPGGNTPVKPRVFPWPFTVDNLNVAFPSGLLGLDFSNASVDSYGTPSGWQSGLIAVPSGLPSGFTLNNDSGTWYGGASNLSMPTDPFLLQTYAGLGRQGQYQPWLRGQSQYSYSGTLVNNYSDPNTFIPGYPRILINGGLYDHPVGPSNAGQTTLGTLQNGSQYVIQPTSVTSGTQSFALGWFPIGVGVRNILVNCSITGAPTVPTLSSCNLVIYRKSDWTNTGATPPPIMVSSNALSFVPGSAGQALCVNQLLSQISVPNGTLGNVYLQLECVGNTSGYQISVPANGLTCGFCNRVDIPYIYTCSGNYLDQQLVAPGGYDASILASPNLRAPSTLTSTMTLFDHAVTGDDWFVIVTATLVAGTYTLSTSDIWDYGGYIVGPNGVNISLGGFTSSQIFSAPTTGVYVFAVRNSTTNPIHLKVA